MWLKFLIISLYILVSLLLGFIVKRRLEEEEYYLAGRRLTPFFFVGTMLATNMSAFTIFGTSGTGYRDGLAFFPVMGFGTGFMALSFLVLGGRIWELGKRYGLVTPAELVRRIYSSRLLAVLFAIVLVIFTLPYVALQPYAGGKVIGALFGVPDYCGAILITVIIVLYTLRGGLRAIVVTDIFQGLFMLLLLLASLYVVSAYYGGLGAALSKVSAATPQLLAKSGADGRYSALMYLGYILLWFFCDPMFPQLFQRFYAAESPRVIRICSICYPLFCAVIFIIPVTLGVLGHIDFPGLERGESDKIMALLMSRAGGEIFGTLVLTAGLAALMSTLDSQLLTLSSIFSRDILPLIRHTAAENNNTIKRSRILVLLIAFAGLIIALTTDATMLRLGMTAFTGLAVLFPTVVFGLYLRRPRCASAAGSIIFGEILVLLKHYRLLPGSGADGVILVLGGSILSYLLVQAMLGGISWPSWRLAGRGVLIILLLGLGISSIGVAGSPEIHYIYPDWVWSYIGLGLLQMAGCWLVVVRRKSSEIDCNSAVERYNSCTGVESKG